MIYSMNSTLYDNLSKREHMTHPQIIDYVNANLMGHPVTGLDKPEEKEFIERKVVRKITDVVIRQDVIDRPKLQFKKEKNGKQR